MLRPLVRSFELRKISARSEPLDVESSAVVFIALALLSIWILACVTDINFPSGARAARLFAAALVLLLGYVEFRVPWRGVQLALFLWPQGLIFTELLGAISPHFASLPIFWGGPLAASLTVGHVLGSSSCAQPAPAESKAARATRIALYILILSWIGSAAVAMVRLRNPAAQWAVGHMSWRLLLTPGLNGITPLQSTLAILPPLLLALALLRSARSPHVSVKKWILESLPRTVAAGLAVVCVELLAEHYFHFSFSFDQTPPSGPFPNRNETGPACALCAALALWFVVEQRGRWRWMIVAAVAALATYHTQSRSGYFVALIAVPLLMMQRPSRLKILILAAALAFVSIAFFNLPKPDPVHIDEHSGYGRMVQMSDDLKAGRWENLSSDRIPLWNAAVSMTEHFPILGVGPGCFGAIVSTYAGGRLPVAHLAAHSMPLNILAECGCAAGMAWCVLWLILPAFLFWSKSRNVWTIVTILIGLSNLFDTSWLCPGFTLLACCAVAFCGYAQSEPTEAASQC